MNTGKKIRQPSGGRHFWAVLFAYNSAQVCKSGGQQKFLGDFVGRIFIGKTGCGSAW
jgi:hypothetical protein